ncbi:MAG: hypothetical protein JWO06_1204, partial [Bacteroidota bacterium]|nr:hypothetical protein [Bacteroidota bacterium]
PFCNTFYTMYLHFILHSSPTWGFDARQHRRLICVNLMTMRLRKPTLIAGLVLCAANIFAGTTATSPAPNSEVVFKQTFKLNANFTEDDAYDLVQSWLAKSPDKFTAQNTDLPVVGKSKNKTEVDEAFNNPRPLQTLDPASHRVMAKGIIKYYGGSNSVINLMFVEYYVVLQVIGHEVTATVNEIKYHHYNRNYASTPIYTWQGGKPFECADNIGKLLQANTPEINKLGSFLNDGVEKLFVDLKLALSQKEALAQK